MRRILLLLLFLAIPGYAQIVLQDHTKTAATSGTANVTTAPLNCASANFLVLSEAAYIPGGSTVVISDSSANTWTPLATQTASGLEALTMFYVASPTVSASQTFTATVSGGTGPFVAISVACFSGVLGLAPLSSSTGGFVNNNTSYAPGAVTGVTGSLVVSAISFYVSSDVPTIDTGFGTPDIAGGPGADGVAMSWLVTPSVVNPTWTFLTNDWSAGTNAVFLPGSGSPPPPPPPPPPTATITLEDHTKAAAVSGTASITTIPLHCASANFLVLSEAAYVPGGSTVVISDSSANTWTPLATQTASGLVALTMFYVASPTVSASQTFTATVSGGTGPFVAISVACFSGVLAVSPFSSSSGDVINSSMTLKPGAVTSVAGGLVVSAIAFYVSSDVPTIDTGFGTPDIAGGPGADGVAMSWLVTSSGVNPTWTFLTNDWSAGTNAVFSPAASGGTSQARRHMIN